MSIRRAGTLLGLILLACSTPVLAADPPRDLGALLRPIRERYDLPAMGAAIVSGDVIEAIGVDGVRERGRPEKATVDDQWHLGSCTKAMTATLIAGLVEEGKLSFETTCSQGFPGLEMDPAWRDVPLWLFLHHRSGAPYNIEEQLTAVRFGVGKPTSRDERRRLVECLLGRPPETTPGTTFRYSNAGFYTAGAMAEQATDTAWEDLMRARLFEPLGMTSAGFGPPGSATEVDQPRGHDPTGKAFPPGPDADASPAGGPAGTVHASMRDWAKFLALHAHGERKGGARLLRPESFAKLHEPVGDDPQYAAGWTVLDRPWMGGRVLTHTGSNNMWQCQTSVVPDADYAVLVVCNQAGDGAVKAVNEALNALIQDHLAQASPPPK